jgi:hypothetical protein
MDFVTISTLKKHDENPEILQINDIKKILDNNNNTFVENETRKNVSFNSVCTQYCYSDSESKNRTTSTVYISASPSPLTTISDIESKKRSLSILD